MVFRLQLPYKNSYFLIFINNFIYRIACIYDIYEIIPINNKQEHLYYTLAYFKHLFINY
jgi:hypothetical protein